MQRIGRYDVVERLGAGGFATVYLVRDPVLDSEVAVKVLAENWSDTADLRDRFIREAQLLRRIDSERVVTVHDIGELPTGQPYFVMGLVDRGTLEDRLVVQGQPTVADVVDVANQLAECLRTIHGNDLIHRDIKPSNLLIAGPRSTTDGRDPTQTGVLAPDERLVLGDFGLAKDIALQTTAGVTISAGTGGYAAPEQMSPTGTPDRRTDLYAATGVIYRVVTGITPPPFDPLSESIPFPDHEPWMQGPLGRFFRQGMAYHPPARHDTIDGWVADLIAIVAPDGRPAPLPAGAKSETLLPPDDSSPGSGQPGPQPPTIPSAPTPVIGSATIPSAPSAPSPSSPGRSEPATVPGSAADRPPIHRRGEAWSPDAPTEHRNDGSSGIKRWLALAAAVAALAVIAIGAFVLLAPSGPAIEGPDEVVAGTSATFEASFDGADGFEWVDWNGATQVGDAFTVDALVPGTLSFSVVALIGDERSDETRRTIVISEAPDGPEIVGPAEVRVGDTEVYTFEPPPGGGTDPEWIDPNGSHRAASYEISAQGPGRFPIALIVTRPDGTRVGTSLEVQLVDG